MQSTASRGPWPTPPASDAPEPPFVLDLPYDHVRVFLPGLRLALYSVVTNNAWGQQLATLSDEQLLTTWRVMDSFEAVPLAQPLPLRLHLPDAAELHLAAHIGAITTTHDVWDEILQQIKPAMPGPPAEPTDPTARTMRQEVAMVSAELARSIEEVFGKDTPALRANRELASQLIDTM